MKVAKFGGSSLSNATQIQKVAKIIQNDPEIQFVIVSAPGKRDDKDTKVTDLLIHLFDEKVHSGSIERAKQMVLDRYSSIADELSLSKEIITHFDHVLTEYLSSITDPLRLLDALKACGEDFNAQLISQYFQRIGLNARYISPAELGIIVSDEPSNAHLLLESYDKIAQYKHDEQILIIPGFFGYSPNGNIVTFPRGGSDITGAIVARGVEADIYENFTDQSYIYAAHPGIVRKPYPIKEITYREMRELAYSGFGIFHDEALEPLYQVDIPVMVRNTNHPEIDGTKIVAQREINPNLPAIGISCDEGFTAISINKYLLNRQLGFTRKLLQIFENYHISIEHIPTGIDDISVVVRSHQLAAPGTLDALLKDIEEQLDPDFINVETDLAIVVIVGEEMAEVVGTANKATRALASQAINILMINQGASEISMFYTISMDDKDDAIRALYREFFGHLHF